MLKIGVKMYRVAHIKTYFDHMVLPYVVPESIKVEQGKWYIVNTKFGEDIGQAQSGVYEKSKEALEIKSSRPEAAAEADIDDIEIDDASILEQKEEFVPVDLGDNKILREADEGLVKERQRFFEEEKKAVDMAKKEIEELGLEMKLVNVHFMMGKKKIIFNFTADNRIDFRQLVKKLAAIFKTRIEMRQIGVRDAAKIQGGYGVCGIICCCARSNCHINSIFLKMAKDQGFVVNSSKLTGLCGRLMCCLAYENDFYVEEKKKYPTLGSFVTDGKNKYKIISVNILRDEIFASDEMHHQKKFSHNDIEYMKKDEFGVPLYKLHLKTE